MEEFSVQTAHTASKTGLEPLTLSLRRRLRTLTTFDSNENDGGDDDEEKKDVDRNEDDVLRGRSKERAKGGYWEVEISLAGRKKG